MKILLTTLNSKYIHTNLALRYLREMINVLKIEGLEIQTMEFTINENLDDILQKIMLKDWDLIGFSCYIWNIKSTLSLCQTIKSLSYHTKLLLGGPEVSFDAKNLMEKHLFIDYILSGEGEISFQNLILSLYKKENINTIHGLTFRENIPKTENQKINSLQNHTIKSIEKDAPIENLGILPEIYNNDLEKEWENKIVYYEASRGCVFKCSYCLSSVEKSIRFFPIERVKKELLFLVQQGVNQVKFVDRTFNISENNTLGLIDFLQKIDNGKINFHFEVMAHLLTPKIISVLSHVRPGLFQFEIGVQSTTPKTMLSIGRNQDYSTAFERVIELKKGNNIHLHLDLIAGLPYESLQEFIRSFNDVFGLEPDALQLGFLKLLKGTPLRAQAATLGIVFRQYPSYEVLFTPWISYREIFQLKNIEKVVDRFYNSIRHKRSLLYLYRFYFYKNGYQLFQQLSSFLPDNNYSKEAEYNFLIDFEKSLSENKHGLFKDMVAYDYATSGRFSRLPFASSEDYGVQNEKIWLLLANNDLIFKLGFSKDTSNKEIFKRVGYVQMHYNINDFFQKNIITKEESILLINYSAPRSWNGDYPHIFVRKEDY